MSPTLGAPVAVHVGSARGLRFAALEPSIEAALPRWIETRRVDGGEELRTGAVWRVGAHVAKFAGPERWLRRSSAIRAALAAARCSADAELARQARFPAPRLALEWGSLLRVEGSLLVSEFVDGRSLFEVWNREPRAVERFASFLAALERAGIDHGDFHPENVLWDGERWTLLDLEALRPAAARAAGAAGRRREELRFARVLRALDFDPRFAEVHARYTSELGRGVSEGAWRSIESRARAMPPIPPQRLARIRALLGGTLARGRVE